jgi:ethanolamine ammonia-lyase small subunit
MTDLTSERLASSSLTGRLSSLTPARVALGRTGASLTTKEVLRFQLAHAEARDAVHAPPDGEALAAGITALGRNVVRVETPATRRDVYLRRPDLGRRLKAESAECLDKLRRDGFDIAIVVADGLSSRAVTNNAVPLLSRLIPKLADVGLTLAPVVVAEGARVALGDEIAERLGARLVLVLIGERPGLSSPDSLGAYLTYAPRPGLTDAERNCVSNIRAGGLDVEAASSKLVWLVMKALATGTSGVQLKDESSAHGLPPRTPELWRSQTRRRQQSRDGWIPVFGRRSQWHDCAK